MRLRIICGAISGLLKRTWISVLVRVAFDRYLGGNMDQCLRMNLVRDYRAWNVEGQYLDQSEDDTVYCVDVLSKLEAKKMIHRIPDFLIFLESAFQQ
jgi:hypothetical protein